MNSSNLKILVVGDGRSNIHEVPLSKAFEEIGIKTSSFFWGKFFNSNFFFINIILRIFDKYQFKPYLFLVNLLLFLKIKKIRPNLIFLYRPTHILSFLIFMTKLFFKDIKIFAYNNDDPFSKKYKTNVWGNFFKIIPKMDLIFCYRNKNILDFRKMGFTNTALLLPWFIPDRHKPIEKFNQNKKYDVVFIGHYENDNRLEILEKIRNSGFSIGIFGPPYEWNHVLEKSEYLSDLSPVRLVWEEEYSETINSSKIAICFMSKLNNDSYTRRNFEIPACGIAQISEYSEDLAKIFTEEEEIILFKNPDDAVAKLRNILLDNDKLEDLARRGRNRIIKDNHDIISRAKYIINRI